MECSLSSSLEAPSPLLARRRSPADQWLHGFPEHLQAVQDMLGNLVTTGLILFMFWSIL